LSIHRPLEEWSLILTVDESRLAGDEAEAKLVVEAATAGATVSQADLSIRATRERQLQSFPGEFYVRRAGNEIVTKNLILKLGPQFLEAGAGNFEVTHDLGNDLAIGDISGSGKIRRVTLTFQPGSKAVSGSISIRLKGSASAEAVVETVIPVKFSE
jgi:hypothetical protein